MIRSFLAAVFLFSGLLAPICATSQPAPRFCAPTDNTVASGVCAPSVEIDTPSGTGTGTVVQWQGRKLVVGAAHVSPTVGMVVRLRKEVKRDEACKVEFDAKVIFAGDPNDAKSIDVAILEPDPLCDYPATVIDETVSLVRGEDAWICGTAGGHHSMLAKGIINRAEYRKEFHTWLLFNGAAWYGHSGAGVFVQRDGKHVLVGVVSGALWGGVGITRSPARCEPLSAILKALKSLDIKEKPCA